MSEAQPDGEAVEELRRLAPDVETLARALAAVSYTHLDVYKRQL